MADQQNGTKQKNNNNGDNFGTIESKADRIQEKLESLQEKLSDEMNSITMKEIAIDIQYMAIHLVGDQSHLFEESFIGHLKVVGCLVDDMPADFRQYFKEITDVLCDLCPKIVSKAVFHHRVLRRWHYLAQQIPSTIIKTMTQVENFKKCAECLASANTISMQQKMLEILYAYGKHAPEGPIRWLQTIFKEISFRTSDINNFIEFITNGFVDEQLFLYHFNQRLSKRTIHSEMIQYLLFGDEIVNCEEKNGRFVHFNGKSIEFWFPYDDKVSKEIELKVVIKAATIKKVFLEDDGTSFVRVMAFELDKLARFENFNENKIKLANFQKSNVITIVFMCGFRKSQLNDLLVQMFDIDAEKLHEFVEIRSDLVPCAADTADDDDSDDEPIVFIPVEIERRKPIKVDSDHTRFKSQSKNSEKSSEIHVKPSDLLKEKLLKSKIQKPNPFNPPVETIDLSDGDYGEPSSKTKPTDFKFKSSAFYSKKLPDESPPVVRTESIIEKNSPAKRQKRGAAEEPMVIETEKDAEKKTPVKRQKRGVAEEATFPKTVTIEGKETLSKRPKRGAAAAANKKISNTELQVYDPDGSDYVPQQKAKKRIPAKRKTDEPIGPVINIPIKRLKSIEPRKLYDPDLDDAIDLVADDAPKKASMKHIWKKPPDIVAPDSFRSSILGDDNRKNKRIWDNISKANESANAQNLSNVSFSYCSSIALRKQEPADSTIASTDENQAPDSYNENIDMRDGKIDANGNIKECKHCCEREKLIIDGLKKVSKSVKDLMKCLKTSVDCSGSCHCEEV